ncbi:hypothetical protein ACET3Z_022067 [Daucus carota]
MVALKIFFFPVMAHGHMIPVLDMAKLFAFRGVHSTIITTPLNAHAFAKGVEKTNDLGFHMSLEILKFPKVEGLPEDCENADQIADSALLPAFFAATRMLRDQLEQVLEARRPNCLVCDMFFPWAVDLAAGLNIPTLVFHGSGFFASCAGEQMRLQRPYKGLKNDSDEFVLPNLPHKVKFCLSEIPPHERTEENSVFAKTLIEAKECELRSLGVVVNSFYELEPDYADHYRNVLKRKAWHIGPVSLCNRSFEEKAQRGKQAAISEDECLKWLDSKSVNSVVYVCFGSISKFPSKQLHEIAVGLEASEQQFVWVVRRTGDEEIEDWMPEGFEERTKGRGLMIRGWAPQVMILDHEAVGGFVTHCGWNSTLEGIAAGVPMVTWPSFAEQFYNEKLITDVLRIGVAVGAKEWVVGTGGGNVKRDAVEMAVRSIIVGEEAEERRNRCKGLKEMARKAIEEGGSSHSDLSALIQELSSYSS